MNLKELEKIASQLEPNAQQRSEISQQANNYINRFISTMQDRPGYRAGEVKKLKTFEVKEEGRPFDQLLEVLGDEVDALGIDSASGAHLGYIPGGGLWTSAIADMLVATANRYAGIAYSSPGSVEIENQMIHWMTSMVGYPAEAHGNLTSGGSIANLIAIKAARDAHKIGADNVKKSVIYFTEQVHHCIHKAINITGLQEAIFRPIALNKSYQMDIDALQHQIEKDKDEGLSPFLVIATAGTTDTGAVDPLDRIADLAARYGLWFHIDAAYGGFFMLVDEVKEKFKGIERSDSVVMDPHKTLFIPYGSGVVLLRDRKQLLEAFGHAGGAYMNDAYGVDSINPADTGPELSRHFRGLRMWLPLHFHGLAPFRANLAEKLMLCQYFYRTIGEMGFETGPKPGLSIAIFRYPEGENNDINKQLIDALHKDGRIFMSSTTIEGKLWIRCAVVSFRTHLREIRLALQMVKENIEKIAPGKIKAFSISN